MSDATRKRAEIVSSFNDAGTGESFTAGDTPMLDAGVFANYEAAGLVRTPGAASKPSTISDSAGSKASGSGADGAGA